MRDMVNKGRISPRGGERNPKAKLTAEQVLEIRSDKWAGRERSEIAAHFNISKSQVTSILLRTSWAHLDDAHDAPHEKGVRKLTKRDVIAIRSDLYSGWTLTKIAEHFGIGKSQVSHILNRTSWAHI